MEDKESVVHNLQKTIAFNPLAFKPGAAHPSNHVNQPSTSSVRRTSTIPIHRKASQVQLVEREHRIAALDPNDPANLPEILEICHEMEGETTQVTQDVRETRASVRAMRSDIDVYSRMTLPRAVMTKFARDASSGLDQLQELVHVPHRKKGQGVWYRIDPESFRREENSKKANDALAMRREHLSGDTVFRAGWMYKEGSIVRNWKRRLFIMYGSSIEYYVKADDVKPKGEIKLGTATISGVQSRPGVEKPCMELVFNQKDRKWRFTSEIISDNVMWYSAIHNRIETLEYVRRCEVANTIPDARILQFLNYVPSHLDPLAEALNAESESESKVPMAVKKEEWPSSHPLILNGARLNQDGVKMVANILSDSSLCPYGGVSQLQIINSSLGPHELEIVCNAIADSQYNVVNQNEQWRQQLGRSSSHSELYFGPSEKHALQSLDLSKNQFVAENDHDKLPAVHALARVFTSSTTLSEIYLHQCHITDECLKILSTSIEKRYSPIRCIGLSGNRISDSGAVALCEALISKPGVRTSQEEEAPVFSLEELDLSRNQVGDEGGRAIAKFIAQPSCKLVQLNLSHNVIGDGGVLPIAEAMRGNKVVRVLDLADNPITEGPRGAAAALTYMAQVNTTIHSLNFLGYRVHASTLNAMRLAKNFGFENKKVHA